MVVRDGDHPEAPLEVLMVRRSLVADFVGGAHVFPGGAVDDLDGMAHAPASCVGLDDGAASRRLGVASGGLAFWVAAIRECFEEAGILLARRVSDGAPVAMSEPGVAERFAEHRRAINERRTTFLAICEQERIGPAAADLHYFAHWITPEGPPRRYDTRFFVAQAPSDQTAVHDEGETIASVWVRPADALARHRAGTMELILPTIRNLQAIGRFETAAALLDAAASMDAVPAILPRLVPGDGGLRLVLPGEAGYEAADAALPTDFDAVARAASRAANPDPERGSVPSQGAS